MFDKLNKITENLSKIGKEYDQIKRAYGIDVQADPPRQRSRPNAAIAARQSNVDLPEVST